MAFQVSIEKGVAEVVIDNPPVNAFATRDWALLGNRITELGTSGEAGAVVIRAEGRGFQCGVDVKELAEDGTR